VVCYYTFQTGLNVEKFSLIFREIIFEHTLFLLSVSVALAEYSVSAEYSADTFGRTLLFAKVAMIGHGTIAKLFDIIVLTLVMVDGNMVCTRSKTSDIRGRKTSDSQECMAHLAAAIHSQDSPFFHMKFCQKSLQFPFFLVATLRAQCDASQRAT
jgi:hypothetical protein